MSTNDSEKTADNSFKTLVNQIKESEQYEIEVVRGLISDQIFDAMSAQNISKADLARKLKTSAPYITKILQGNGNFTIETLVRIARALEMQFRPKFVPRFYSWRNVQVCKGSVDFTDDHPDPAYAAGFKGRFDIHASSITDTPDNHENSPNESIY